MRVTTCCMKCCFRLDPDIEQSWHQMHPILCIPLKSNKKAQNCNWDKLESFPQGIRILQDDVRPVKLVGSQVQIMVVVVVIVVVVVEVVVVLLLLVQLA